MSIHEITIKTEDQTVLGATVVNAASASAKWVVLVHGITADRHEEGTFTVLAEKLETAGFHSIRFDFRGHGKSLIQSGAMTVAGEMLDLKGGLIG